MRRFAAAALTVFSFGVPLPVLAEPAEPGCVQDVMQQSIVGGVVAIVPGGRHLPGPHILELPRSTSVFSPTEFPQAFSKTAAQGSLVGMSMAAGGYNALLQSALPPDAAWLDRAGAAMVANGLFAAPLGPEVAGPAALYGGAQSAISSFAQSQAPSSSGVDVAKRAAINGIGNMALAGTTVVVIMGTAVEGAILVSAMATAGVVAWGATFIGAIPAVVPCIPVSAPANNAPTPIPTPPPTATLAPALPSAPTPTAIPVPTPVPVVIVSCSAGKERVAQMKYEMESARKSGKSFNYSPDALPSLLEQVTTICERETAAKPGGTCTEAKDTLAKFRGTVEQACKSDAAWCSRSKEELRGVIERTSQTCEREQVANTPRQPRARTAARPRQPTRVAPQAVAPQPRGPTPEEIAAAAEIAAGIITIIGGMQRPRGPVYQPPAPAAAPPPRCHYGPDGRLHCGRG